jgi:hypothetical protein
VITVGALAGNGGGSARGAGTDAGDSTFGTTCGAVIGSAGESEGRFSSGLSGPILMVSGGWAFCENEGQSNARTMAHEKTPLARGRRSLSWVARFSFVIPS